MSRGPAGMPTETLGAPQTRETPPPPSPPAPAPGRPGSPASSPGGSAAAAAPPPPPGAARWPPAPPCAGQRQSRSGRRPRGPGAGRDPRRAGLPRPSGRALTAGRRSPPAAASAPAPPWAAAPAPTSCSSRSRRPAPAAAASAPDPDGRHGWTAEGHGRQTAPGPRRPPRPRPLLRGARPACTGCTSVPGLCPFRGGALSAAQRALVLLGSAVLPAGAGTWPTSGPRVLGQGS